MSELAINTPPALIQCQNVTITWTGGVEPYYVGYIASGTIQSTSSPAVAFKTDGKSRNWQCNVAAGVTISLSVRDSNGQIVYSAPSTVQNSSDMSCLPGYVDPNSSSGLSGGAIGGIVGGIIGGLLIVGLIFGLVWRRRKRRRSEKEGYGDHQEKESFEEGGEPKVEPYVGRGEVDLGPEEDDSPLSAEPTTTPSPTDQSTDLERQTKQMLGVTSTPTSTGPSHSQISPIPSKSQQVSSPIETTTGRSDPSTSAAATPTEEERRSPVRREQEVEFVRHTDGGMVQVELPPLYSDVPRG